MNSVLFAVSGIQVTIWTVTGLAGAALFASRWVVQVFHSKAYGSSSIPPLFWYMSAAGSVLLIAYFSFGARDLVGVASNALPLLVSSYNLYLVCKERAKR
ncbi:MAG: lipid-A-disaccharide synthase N-terminal domain-containing protein [Candidatus Taylorbacteria bacterium]|nr:lipid-A-disaccharide synthase N-terminal domain-containing protein [Candidatus Taylorbacteria bacterium]